MDARCAVGEEFAALGDGEVDARFQNFFRFVLYGEEDVVDFLRHVRPAGRAEFGKAFVVGNR